MMEWRGKRFGECLAFRRTYDLDIYRYVSDIYNKFFEDLNHHIKRHLERYYFKNGNYVIPPEKFKPNLATLNEILTKQGLHHLMNAPEPTGVRPISSLIGGEYEKPWIFKDCGDVDCVNAVVVHTTAVGIEPIRNPDGCSD